jgi:hypothetical protein
VLELGEGWSAVRLLGGWERTPTAQWLELWDLYRAKTLQFKDLRVVAAIVARTGPWNARAPLQAAELQRLADLSPWGIQDALESLQGAQMLDCSAEGIVRWRGPDPARLARHACAQIPFPKREIPIPRRLLLRLARTRRPAVFATVLGHLVRGLWFTGPRIATVGRVRLGWIADRFGLSERAVRAAHQELVRLGWIVVLSDPQASTAQDRGWDGPRFAFNPFGTYPELEPPKPRKQPATTAREPAAEPEPPNAQGRCAAAAALAQSDFAGGVPSESAGGAANDFAPPKEHSEIASAVPAEAISRNHDHCELARRRSTERARVRETESSDPNPAPSHGALTSRFQTKSLEEPPLQPRPLVIRHLEPAGLLEFEALESVFRAACAAGLLERTQPGWLTLVGIAMAALRLYRAGRLRNPGGYVYSTLRGGLHRRIESCDERAALAQIRRWEAQREELEAARPSAAASCAPVVGRTPPTPAQSSPRERAASSPAAELRPLEQYRERLETPQVQAALRAALSVLEERNASEQKSLAQTARHALDLRLSRGEPVGLLEVQAALNAVLADEERERCAQALAHAAPWLSRWGRRRAESPRGRSPIACTERAARAVQSPPPTQTESRPARRLYPGQLTRTQALQMLRELVLRREEYPLEERKRLGTLAWEYVVQDAARVIITCAVVERAVEGVMGPAPLARAS